MRYISTRGQAPTLNFEDVLLAGLASDGGLYVPENLPRFTLEEIASWVGLPYHELAFRVMRPFVAGSIADADFKKILEETYGVFAHDAVAPLRQLNGNEWVLELFHGPTLAFKDFALQLLGRLLDHVLAKRGERVVIMGATSGDTGSAAIEGCRRCDNVDIFIMHPHNRVSEVQRRQMTTILGDNIHNIAIEGNFDDCQEMVKASFADQGFLKGTRLVAVNSINWARIMAQIVYYFHAALQLGAPHRSVAFSVPTGNFGDIFAGYLARNMGLPVSQLIVATNRNDILHRFMSGNRYDKGHPASLAVAVDGYHGLVQLRTPVVRPARPQRQGRRRTAGCLQGQRQAVGGRPALDRGAQAVRLPWRSATSRPARPSPRYTAPVASCSTRTPPLACVPPANAGAA